MLRNYACKLVELAAANPRDVLQLIMNTAELCLERYPYCRALILQSVNSRLERLGAEKLDEEDFADVEGLLSSLRRRLQEYSLDKLVKARHASREEIAEAVDAAAARILYASLLAALDALGVECPVRLPSPEQTA